MVITDSIGAFFCLNAARAGLAAATVDNAREASGPKDFGRREGVSLLLYGMGRFSGNMTRVPSTERMIATAPRYARPIVIGGAEAPGATYAFWEPQIQADIESKGKLCHQLGRAKAMSLSAAPAITARSASAGSQFP